MIKSPMEVVGGFLRNAEVAYISDATNLDEDYWTHLMLMFNMDQMGYFLGNPPSVSGWPAYYQIPAYDQLWITTFTLISRIIISDSFIHDGFWTPAKRIPWDLLTYTESLDDPFDPNAIIDEMCVRHLAIPLDTDRKEQLRSILLSGQNTNSYWTNAWADYSADPTNQMNRDIVLSRLKFFYTTFFQMPEYQLL